jgi:hypothetical protein
MQQSAGARGLARAGAGCQGCLGGLLASFLFILIGGGLTWWGWTIVQTARASAGWPSVEGRILRSEVTRSTDGDGDDSYSPEVTYRYVVDGQSYESYTIKFGENAYGNRNTAEAIAARYPDGSRVTVYYDPADPERAVLEPGVSAGSYIVFSIGAIFLVVGLVIPPAGGLVSLARGRAVDFEGD